MTNVLYWFNFVKKKKKINVNILHLSCFVPTQMMKMSYNKLKIISRQTFRGLWNLARLHLDHNHLEFIHPDAFQGLTSLRLLQLEGNRLQQLHPATFATFSVLGYFPMSTLKHLYLSENGLTTLSPTMFATMPQLETLFLHDNPWTCDCRMKWFKDWSSNSPGQHHVILHIAKQGVVRAKGNVATLSLTKICQ